MQTQLAIRNSNSKNTVVVPAAVAAKFLPLNLGPDDVNVTHPVL